MFARHIVPFGMKNPSYQSSYEHPRASDRHPGGLKEAAKEVTSMVECIRPALGLNMANAMIHIGVGLTNRGNGPPAKQLPESSTEIGKVISILEGGHARAADNLV